MNYLLIASIVIVGLSGIVAQILLLRELLVSFYGNELVIGVILANWIAAEAIGAFAFGRYSDKAKNKPGIFIILQLVFSLILPLTVYLVRVFKNILGVPFGEAIGLYTIAIASFLIILPVSLCHGALFSLSCQISNSIGQAYAWETFGTIIGGIIFTYILIPYLNSFQIAFLISIIGLVGCWFLARKYSRSLKYASALAILIFGYLAASGNINKIQNFSVNRQWRGKLVLDYRNSVYGNIVATRQDNQYTFFYNGIPAVTIPKPDITFVQEFGNLPLLFNRDPKDILVISGGAGGLITEILKHKVRKIDYIELDPLIIAMLKKYPVELTQKELTDKRLNIKNLDGRFFIRTTPNTYDVVLVGSSNPSELSINRFFTQDFFVLVKARLNAGGILGLCLPGSTAALSPQLRDLNACILNGLKRVYPYIRIIPGDYNMFLASPDNEITGVNPAVILERINQRQIKTDILRPSYLNYRLDKSWLDWFERSLVNATTKINRDTMPFAVFESLIIWNKQFSVATAHFFEFFQDSNLGCAAFVIFMLTFMLWIAFYQRSNFGKLILAYSIATTGFFGMLASLILTFSFQAYYGYLYQKIGILITVFMFGTAAGSILVTRNLSRIKNGLSLFFAFEASIILFSLSLAMILNRFISHFYSLSLVFGILFFTSGFLVGLEFPLAAKILNQHQQIGLTAGILYFFDLSGGWIAGILGGIVFLPIFGLFNTCMLMVLFKLSSLLLLVFARQRTFLLGGETFS